MCLLLVFLTYQCRNNDFVYVSNYCLKKVANFGMLAKAARVYYGIRHLSFISAFKTTGRRLRKLM